LTGDFKPGDDFSDHLRLTIVDGSDTYHPDGQVRDEDYEYASFLSSRMHSRGVACMDCHNPHSMKTLLPGNWLCMRCHNGSYTNAPVIEPVAHSRHKVFGYDTNAVLTNFNLTIYKPKEIKETGGECVNCHMPQTAYMQRHWRHDHGFTIPDPLLTKQLGVPNACNRCHQDKDADWALKYCDEWYGAKMERPTRRRAQIIAAARKGEAGARDGLLGLLATEEIPYWRAVAAGLLESWVGEPAVGSALTRGLADTNALVRAECVRALEPLVEANAPAAIDSIHQRLNDPARNVRVAAAWALRSSVDPASKAGTEMLYSLDLNADQPAGQMQKGAYALARNNPTQAVTHYQKAVEWDPNSAPIRHDFAVVLAGLNRNQEAVQQLEAACRLAPADAEYRFKLGLALSATGNLTETIKALQEAVRLDPRHARAWYNLGLALNAAGEAWPAIEALQRAEGISPADPQIPYARATILVRAGRLQEAKAAASRALEISPNFGDARALLDELSRMSPAK
jgi:tetratricopeptide (TPR) repeat protein